MFDQCWATVYDVDPKLVKHWLDVSCYLGTAMTVLLQWRWLHQQIAEAHCCGSYAEADMACMRGRIRIAMRGLIRLVCGGRYGSLCGGWYGSYAGADTAWNAGVDTAHMLGRTRVICGGWYSSYEVANTGRLRGRIQVAMWGRIWVKHVCDRERKLSCLTQYKRII